MPLGKLAHYPTIGSGDVVGAPAANSAAAAGDVIQLSNNKHRNIMQRSSDRFYAVRIDFGDYVRNLQYNDRRTAEIVLQQSRARYGYNNAALIEVCY